MPRIGGGNACSTWHVPQGAFGSAGTAHCAHCAEPIDLLERQCWACGFLVDLADHEDELVTIA